MSRSVKLATREFFSTDYKCTLYMVSVVGGPQSLLARRTEEAALEDGAAYVAANWGRDADGNWTPYREKWVTL